MCELRERMVLALEHRGVAQRFASLTRDTALERDVRPLTLVMHAVHCSHTATAEQALHAVPPCDDRADGIDEPVFHGSMFSRPRGLTDAQSHQTLES